MGTDKYVIKWDNEDQSYRATRWRMLGKCGEILSDNFVLKKLPIKATNLKGERVCVVCEKDSWKQERPER